MPSSRWPHRPLAPWVFPAALLCAALAAVWARAHPSPAPVVAQAFIGFIIAALSALASWLGAAGTAIASATVAMVQWLAGSVAWLTARVGNAIKSTGAMFSKVWDVSKKFWFDVVRPALQRVAQWVKEARDWLKQKLGPVFRLLSKIRERIRDIYSKWIRPVMDAIDTARGILKILEKLHVPFAAALDSYLAQFEDWVTSRFLQLTAIINKATDILNSVVTFDLLFQQVPFLNTLRRDTPLWVRMFWNSQVVGITPETRAALAARKYKGEDPAEYGRKLGEFYRTGGGDLAPVIAELVPLWKSAAGLK